MLDQHLFRRQDIILTYWGRVTHICVGNLTIIGSDNETKHYLNECRNIVNWTLRNKVQWNFNRNSNIFIQENAFQNVVCEMASILSRPQCVSQCGLLQIGPLRTHFSEIWIEIQSFSSIKMHLKMSPAKWWPFCPEEMSWRNSRSIVGFDYPYSSRGWGWGGGGWGWGVTGACSIAN